jgi:hypothetical protein
MMTLTYWRRRLFGSVPGTVIDTVPVAWYEWHVNLCSSNFIPPLAPDGGSKHVE